MNAPGGLPDREVLRERGLPFFSQPWVSRSPAVHRDQEAIPITPGQHLAHVARALLSLDQLHHPGMCLGHDEGIRPALQPEHRPGVPGLDQH